MIVLGVAYTVGGIIVATESAKAVRNPQWGMWPLVVAFWPLVLIGKMLR